MGNKLAAALLKPINTSAVILLGVYTTVWGLWVANPFWEVFARAPLYNAMNSLMPEWAWGCIAIVCGLVIIYGVLKPSYSTLTRGAQVGTWHWLAIAVLYFVGDVYSTGGITSLTFAVYSAFVYLNIRVNKVIPESHKEEGG